ncbi:MAG TPA: tyrosine-type recombinase/integrase [Acidimicrobiales bacterium]|nr:tyrosine-type recombinase/integrase [Acidimicrobiales bacterium]
MGKPELTSETKPKARRVYGEGTLWWDGTRWRGSIDVGRHPETGRRMRRKASGKTEAEVWRKLRAIRREIDSGKRALGGPMTVGQALDRWLEVRVVRKGRSENTVSSYRGVIESQLKPGLGHIQAAQLTAAQVEDFLHARASAGLSRSYVGRMRRLLVNALRYAESHGTVPRNVAGLVDMPDCKDTMGRRSFTHSEAKALIEAAKGHRLEALILTGISLGLRPGELTGLRWPDLALEAETPTLAVKQSLKRMPDGDLVLGPVKRSRAGQRTIALPAYLATALRAHRARQGAERLALGVIWDDEYDLVFPADNGRPLDPSNLRHAFARLVAKAGMDPAHNPPYLMRHTAASLLVDGGESVEAVADLFGDNPETVLRHYRHQVRDVATAAASRMTAILGEEAS